MPGSNHAVVIFRICFLFVLMRSDPKCSNVLDNNSHSNNTSESGLDSEL